MAYNKTSIEPESVKMKLRHLYLAT